MHKQFIQIKETNTKDLSDILEVERLAFPDEAEVVELSDDLLKDVSAAPLVSLLAYFKGEAVGHILFTKAIFNHASNQPMMHILAPLAVKPAFQRKGIGGMLIKKGLEILKAKGSELVFVLGHIEYYPNHGFIPDAGKLGFSAPYPIPENVKEAWMVQELVPGALEGNQGSVQCADAMNQAKYWRD